MFGGGICPKKVFTKLHWEYALLLINVEINMHCCINVAIVNMRCCINVAIVHIRYCRNVAKINMRCCLILGIVKKIPMLEKVTQFSQILKMGLW